MQKLLLLLLPAMLAFSSCNLFDNYGKKVKIGESEVFYKGEGVTKEDAEKVGDFLLENKIISKKQKSSAQVTKDEESYIVHLVMDAKTIEPSLRLNMWRLQADLSKEVFDGEDARFAFTDDRLKDQEVLEPVNVVKFGSASVIYDSGEFTKSSVQKFADFLKEKGLVTGENEADILLRKEDEVPVVRIIVNKDYMEENGETVLPVFGYWQYLIQNELSSFKKAKFWLTTTTYEDYKKVPKLSAEDVARFETGQTGEETTTTTEALHDTTETDLSSVPAPQNH